MKFTELMHDFRVWRTRPRFCVICGHKRHNWRHWKRKETKETEVIPIPDFAKWDGKNLAVIQMLVVNVPRINGIPVVQVDHEWNLTVSGKTVPVGSVILVAHDGVISVVTQGQGNDL
jgi:hypothetical protein